MSLPHAIPTPAARRLRSRRAFTLVEICLSLGIMTFAMTAMLGLLPLSLNQLAVTDDRSQAQKIAQQVIVEARQTTFSALTSTGNYSRYFTGDAQVTKAGDASVAYAATVNVSQDASGGSTSSLVPGADPAPTMAKLNITICKASSLGIQKNATVANCVTMLTCNDLSDYYNPGQSQ